MSSRHKGRHVIWLAALPIVLSTGVAACNRQPPGGGARAARGGVRDEDTEPSVLPRHAAWRGGSGRQARRRAGGAGGRARDRRREADADHREPDPDRHPRSVRHAERLAGGRLRSGQGQRRGDPDRRRRHARRCWRGPAAGVKLGTFVGSDNYEGGRLAGQYLVQSTGGQAKVAILEGIPGHETGDSRLRGFRDAVAGSPGITIVASQPANWERDQGFTVFQNMLQAHADIDACSRPAT